MKLKQTLNMNQKNNNEERENLNVDELYDIAKRLKDNKLEKQSTAAVLRKNPNMTMRQRYDIAKAEYQRALTDFNYFVEKYVYLYPSTINKVKVNEDGSISKMESDNVISEISKQRLLKIIQEETEKVLSQYLKNDEN